MAHITEMGGHSGCQVQLVEVENGNIFVRKISSSVQYNSRLIIQKNKQELYLNDEIRTPRILGTGYTDMGCFYFDMEYIRGITMAEFMKTVEVGRIRNLVEQITHNMIRGNEGKPKNEGVFQSKIDELSRKLYNWNSASVGKGLRALKDHRWCNFLQSPCHGDLTLENIIVKDDHLYIIDFLDSFYDSWLLDIATLLQDAQILWAYRYQERIDINALIRLVIFRDILIDETRRIAGSEYIVEIYYALLLKLIRICPYAKDMKTRIFLEGKIESVLHIIEEAKV